MHVLARGVSQRCKCCDSDSDGGSDSTSAGERVADVLNEKPQPPLLRSLFFSSCFIRPVLLLL